MRVRATIRCLYLGGLVLACLLLRPATAPAETPSHTSPATGRETTRTEVVLRVEGALEPTSEAALGSVLQAELAPMQVQGSVVRSEVPVAAWLIESARSPTALVVAVLDVRDANIWQLTLVDAARGRAIRRELVPDAAAYEAVASVLTAATAALKDGLEVASQPLAEVVVSKPATAPTKPAIPVQMAPKTAPRVRLFAELGLGVASLAPAASISPGLGAGLGLQSHAGLGAHIRGTLSLAARVPSDFGSFELHRRDVDVSLGLARAVGALTLEPTLGVRAELVQRSVGEATQNALQLGEQSAWRCGPAASVRLRLPLLSWAALELSGNAAYYPRLIRYLARVPETGTELELARLSRISLGAELGVSIQPAP